MRKNFLISVLVLILIATSIPLYSSIKNHNTLQEMYIKNSIEQPLVKLAGNLTLIHRQFDELLAADDISLSDAEILKDNVIRTNLYFSDFRNNYNDFIGEEDDLAIRDTGFESDLLLVQVNLQAVEDDLSDSDGIDEQHTELLSASEATIAYYHKLLEPYEKESLHEKMNRKKHFKKDDTWGNFINKLSSYEDM